MDRRTLLVGSLGLLVAPLAAEAQPVAGRSRIAFLSTASLASLSQRLQALREGLQALGYVEGQNLRIEYRSAEGNPARLPGLAVQLAGPQVECIVTAGNTPTQAAQRATSTIPIVMTTSTDPVGQGFAASLGRPGRNITGLSIIFTNLAGKRLEVLKEAIPRLSHVAILVNARSATIDLKDIEAAAPRQNVQLIVVPVDGPEALEGAFRSMVQRGADAFTTDSGGFFNTHHARIIELAAHHRLPAMYTEQEFVLAGGLMTYSASIRDLYRRAAVYVDKILKGAKPADLPVEQPTKFELIINLKTAKALGLTIPPSVLARADEVIQ